MISTVTKVSTPVASIRAVAIEEHDHSDRTGPCRFAPPSSTTKNAENAWCPAQDKDLRSPCPALNSLANHGYINRSGKNIYIWDIAMALHRGYALTLPFSIFLCVGTLYLIRQWNPFAPLDLVRIGAHNRVEHNGSLVHDDVSSGMRYASNKINYQLVQELKEEVEENGRHEKPYCVDSLDVARARIRREKVSGTMSSKDQEIARGEMAIATLMWDREALGIKGNAQGIPLDWLLEWLGSERLPSEWLDKLKNKTVKSTGLWDTYKRSQEIKKHVETIRYGAPAKSPLPKIIVGLSLSLLLFYLVIGF